MVSLPLLVVVAALGADGTYEDRLIAWALSHQGRVQEPDPSGLRIEEVLVASEDVFSASDPWPDFLNLVHVRTRENVIRREVLLSPGEAWDPVKIEETDRVLRRLPFLSVARVVAVKGRAGGVGLLVVTKDRLSLRLNSFFTTVGDVLQVLLLRPSEQNFLGRGQRIVLEFLLYLDTLQISQSFQEPRLFGSRVGLFEAAGVIINRQSGQPEGTIGELRVGRPIASLDQRWAFNVEGGWLLKTQRTFCAAVICNDEGVPRVYDVRRLRAEASVTRSFGALWKTDVTAALGGYHRRFEAPSNSTPEQRRLLEERVLPRSEDATYVSALFRLFRADFRILKNVDTYELTEDYQLGPLLQLGARWAVPIVSANHFVELGGALRYRWLIAEDLLTLSVAAAVRLAPGAEAVNRHLAVEVVNASPPFHGGRLVTRVLLDVIKFDLDRRVQLLGGSTGLRGARAEGLSGRNLFLVNLEYRARAIELRTLFVGVVLFWDAGSAFDERIDVTHTVGVGLRILVPQWNQEPLRFDLGFVVPGRGPVGLDSLNATSGQVTSLRPTFLDYPLGGGCESPSCR